MTEPPPVRRRLLGAALRRYREGLGYRLDDAARVLECDRSKISRIESGQRGIRARDLRDLLTEYGVGEQEQRTLAAIAQSPRARGWWQPYADVLPGGWLDYLITETAASQIQAYQPQLVPDLLQTQEYARAVAAADPALPAGTQDLVLEAMLTRQQVILGERRTELAVVIGEAALHQVVGGTGCHARPAGPPRRDERHLLADHDPGPAVRLLARTPPAATGRYRSCGSPTRRAWAWSTCPALAAASAWTARRTLPATPEPSPC